VRERIDCTWAGWYCRGLIDTHGHIYQYVDRHGFFGFERGYVRCCISGVPRLVDRVAAKLPIHPAGAFGTT